MIITYNIIYPHTHTYTLTLTTYLWAKFSEMKSKHRRRCQSLPGASGNNDIPLKHVSQCYAWWPSEMPVETPSARIFLCPYLTDLDFVATLS